jgi:hypothetical protein
MALHTCPSGPIFSSSQYKIYSKYPLGIMDLLTNLLILQLKENPNLHCSQPPPVFQSWRPRSCLVYTLLSNLFLETPFFLASQCPLWFSVAIPINMHNCDNMACMVLELLYLVKKEGKLTGCTFKINLLIHKGILQAFNLNHVKGEYAQIKNNAKACTENCVLDLK